MRTWGEGRGREGGREGGRVSHRWSWANCVVDDMRGWRREGKRGVMGCARDRSAPAEARLLG